MSAREGECVVLLENPGGVHAPVRKSLGGVVEHRPMWGSRHGYGSVDVHVIIIGVSTVVGARGIVNTTLGQDCGRKLAL
jgi:hypothetical protein